MSLKFRNVDADPSDDVRSWPYEGLVSAIDRGLVHDWQPLFVEVRRSPWGLLARRIEHYLSYRKPDGVSTLFRLAVDQARQQQALNEKEEVASRILAAVEASGLTAAEYATLVGTSASRLSTYINGSVTPSAAMLLRIEKTSAFHIVAGREPS